MTDLRKVLKGERNFLLHQWIAAEDNEKVEILVKIMEIEEQLEVEVPKHQQKTWVS